MKLHPYQENCLDGLMEFFAKVKQYGSPKIAFAAAQESRPALSGGQPPPYYDRPLPENTPCVCVRIPTGGGKTLMAAHAVGRIAKEFLNTDTPVCLWLAPSDAIVSQTLKAMQTRGHPCRAALAEKFNGKINCISAAMAMRINRADLDGNATVIVCTVQSLRKEKTAGRKIYEDNGHLMEHFESVPEALRARLQRNLEDGEISYSLVNALQLRRPIIVSDEAHNASTTLSYESLARLNPSCVAEFTATPQTENRPQKGIYASNVVAQASARELKRENMIKFPLNLETHKSWRETARAAVQKQQELEKAAKKLQKETGEYIRPLVLHQAENIGGEANAGAIRNALIADFGVPAEQIAVHTGKQKELEKHAKQNDLLSPECPLRHIITVQALAQGWDCSFAYILCTAANLQSGTAVEQVLGRILRLPGARRKNINALNECYAFAARQNFAEAVREIKDTLVAKSGFQEIDAEDFVHAPEGEAGKLFGGAAPAGQKRAARKPVSVPALAVRESGKLALLDGAHFLGAKWSIAKEKPDMSGFAPPQIYTGKGVIDVGKDGVITVEKETADDLGGQLMLLESDKNWTAAALAAWLDAEIAHPDIPQNQSSPYILAAVGQLAKKHSLTKLARWRFYIKQTLEANIKSLRRKKAAEGWQKMLKSMAVDDGKLEVSAERAFVFERRFYAAHWLCPAPDVFQKHAFPEVGELKESGEEFECARFLDNMPEVEVWVRNLSKHGFWLQTTSDRFYPDFVCRLTDGRVMAVEYKNARDWTNDDSVEKRAIGDIWAKLSGGTCLFVMPKGKDDLGAIQKCAAAKPRG